MSRLIKRPQRPRPLEVFRDLCASALKQQDLARSKGDDRQAAPAAYTCLSSPSEPPGWPAHPLGAPRLGWGEEVRWTGCGNTKLTSRQPAEEQGPNKRLTRRTARCLGHVRAP